MDAEMADRILGHAVADLFRRDQDESAADLESVRAWLSERTEKPVHFSPEMETR